ncbi:LOW QUALITY PROTEIN: apolipoprotein B-100 [Xiphophorus hellerii]|uniref:LOW QUALITY PROTEIN: apolipoprotein B-100 n=1 Tax=Xiphophorus hellerii TaxID=8084 RepID=UPI0013B4149C|nr:LOW QUALITY PROTEIN: apolipoprotein B-100 [Xiphophorus hellerii]
MGSGPLCLLLLLSAALAQDVEEPASCQMASRFKVQRKYVYRYSAEGRNVAPGSASLQNGPKVTCEVEIEVPQMCRFIMHTRDCTVSEAFATDARAEAAYGPAPDSDTFKAVMERSPLKVSVHSNGRVEVYPKADESTNILNVKRGIISAFLVPIMEDGRTGLVSTVHGRCLTTVTVHSRQDVATDASVSRDLSQCDQFYGRTVTSSPVALLQQLHNPISKLISSTQSCRYQFDNRGTHITTAKCTEKHIYLPFSSGENGISSAVTQDLSLQSVKRTSSRRFDADPLQAKSLHFDKPEDKTPVQMKDAVLDTLQELVVLASTDQGQKRTSLFHKLVSNLRVLRNETLSQTVAEMVQVSNWLTFQALFQCGTSECTSAIMQVIWTIDRVSLEVDALVYALALQANPDAARVRDMLSMAQHKQSKAIMFALANTVRKFYQGQVTPEITEVSKFMETILNNCSEEVRDPDRDPAPDPTEEAFLVLRVVGVMGRAMQDVSPSLISSILRCMKKPDVALSNQKAAIQAFRLMDITAEIRRSLLEAYQDPRSPADKRLAAYLVLMKDPDSALIREICSGLLGEKDEQLKSFVLSHLKNIQNSDDEKPELRQLIGALLQDKPSSTDSVFNGLSKNYVLSSPLGSVQSNVIFDSGNTLPKEMKLEASLKAYDRSFDMFQVGLEGAGFEPTVEALFGEKGFLLESFSRLMRFVGDRAPMLRGVLDRISPGPGRKRRQVPDVHLKAIKDGFQQLLHDVQVSAAPEATAFLRLLGDEIGYMKTSEMRKMFETLFMYFHVFIRVLPAQAFSKLTSSTENEMFLHYVFMETSFSLPTASGFPLKFSLSGVFAAGARGGLTPSTVTGVSFMPSGGLEFITHMGVHLPDYVDAGTEMLTNFYHESSFQAKVTVKKNQVELSIPAPKSNRPLLSISNKLLSISSGQTKPVPSLVEDRVDHTDCQLLLKGLNLCTVVSYTNASSVEEAPSFPLTGDATFAVELQPTRKVSEYTASISDETLKEGRKGRHKAQSLKLTLRAEGEEPTEATASVKYNQNKNTFSAELLIPDCDVEATVSLAVTRTDGDGRKTRGFSIDVTNRNVTQFSLAGRARHEMMKEVMTQLQMDIPSLETDASVTATLKNEENVLMDLESVLHLPAASYQQKASLKYDEDKVQLELKTDLTAEIKKMIPHAEDRHIQLQKLIDDMLEQKVAKTDMKLRHIVTKGIEAGNNWLDKLTAQFPSLANLRSKRSISDLMLPPLPEKLFLQFDSLFRYQFNKEKAIISLPLPLGGKTSEELNLPKTLSFPVIELPLMGLHIPAKKFVLPSFSVPTSLDLPIPLLGLAEASTKIHSNLYSWEGSISGGNSTVDIPSYIAQYKAMAQSPIRLLSYELEGVGMISGRAEDNLKYLLNCSFSHIFLDSSVSITETLRVTEKLNARANYKLEASSPLGLETSLHYSAQSKSTLNSDEVSGDGDLTGLLKIASFHTNTSYSHSYNLRPLAREGRGESIFRFDSPFIQFQNVIQGLYENSELNVVSKTSTHGDVFKHVAELKYKDAQLSLKCKAVGLALGKSLNNIVELGVSSRMLIIRIESQADDDNSRVYSLITGSLGSNGVEVNSEGSLTFEVGRALHKASVRAGRDGLSFSGINNIQCSPVTMENIFDGAIDVNGASCSSTTKVMAEEGRGELGFGGKITPSEASLYGDLKGHAYDAATANSMNVVLNRRALTFSGNTKGTLRQMLTENSHKLTLTLWTLSLRSKMENFICEDLYYRQNLKVDAKPFILGVDINNKLRFYDLNLDKEGHMKLEPLKADLRGTLNGAFREEENIKHTYELTYKDWSGSVKYSTSGNIMDAHLSHSCELEFAGLSSNSKCEAKLSSEPLRFSGHLHIQALPFSLAIDSSVDSAGELNLHGKHSGQLFSTLLVKTTPLALGWSHDCRVSTTHRLPARQSSTSFSNKFEGLLTPKDQSLDWKVNSKVNNHAYEQSISAYNNPEKVGLELSGVALTDLLSRYEKSKPELQTFSTAGFLKYDKNSDCHIIEIPFIESFPAAFEHFKMTFIRALESLRQLIENVNINQIITDFRANLDQLPVRVKRFMRNLDLENKVDQIKERLDYLINEFTVTMDDLELGVSNMRQILEKNIVDIVTKVHDFISASEEYINAGHLTDKITTVFSYIEDQLQAFDAKYQIKLWLVRTLDFMEDVIRQMDLQKLRERSAAFLHDLDTKYDILETIREKLSELKNNLEDFNLSQFVEVVKNFLLAFDWASYVELLSYQIPVSEIARVMESMNEVIINWIDEYEVPNKLNTVYSYGKDILLKYEIDDIFKDLMDQAVVLIREWKIEETVQSIVTALKSIKLEMIYNIMLDCLHSIIHKIREIDFKNSIDNLNERISSTVKSMKDFDYSSFVDESNIKIVELTDYLNNEINKYEIVKKIEAVRKFFREIQNYVYTYLDELKNTKVADALKKLKDVIDTAFYNDVKLKVQDILEDMRQRILDMDIRDEIQVYLQRASDSYRNIVTFFSDHFDELVEWMKTLASDKVVDQMKQVVEGVLDQIKRADIEVSTFTIPLTDLEIPGFTINLNKLQEITIPAQISVPEFTILSSCTIPAFIIDFNEIKTKIVAIIDDIRGFQIQTPDLEDIFGNLKVLYLSELPDMTFPDIVLTEIKFPAISIPKLNLQDSGMQMLTIPDVTFPEIPTDICFPVFGKLHGEFSLSFPKYVLINKFKIENSTTDLSNPKFTAIFTSHAKSPVKVLEHTFEAETQLEAPRMESLQFTQTLKATHVAFSVDHEGSLALPGSPADSLAKSTTKVTTQFYTADLLGSVALSLESGVSAVIETSYNHNLDIPTLEVSSQASLKQSMTAKMDPIGVTVTGETSGTGKWSIQDFFDEGTHRTNVELKVDFNTAKLTCVGDIDYQAFKSKHTLTVESALLSHIAVKAQCDSKTPFVKNSVLFLKGEADVADLNAALIVSHAAELTGGLAGTMSNSWEFRAQPFEINVDVKNKVNSKILLPLKLTGKVDLENDYGVVINSERQSACWFALVRFNQYKYSHNLTAENNEKNIYIQSRAEGEANLEFLTIPLSIPEITLPYFQIQTPELRDFSLWEDGDLKSWLINPQQLFDLDLKFQYYKNPDSHCFELHLEPIYSAIKDNFEIIQGQFEACRDKVVTLLKDSYHEARAQYIKHKINTSSLPPKIFRVPGYKIPFLDIQVSAFRAEMPAFSYFVPKEVSTASFRVPALGFSVPSYTFVLPSLRLPIIYVPETLGEIRLPSFTLPAVQDSVVIPAMGNITYDFSFKSTVITLNANAGLYNESDIIARFGAVSVSVFDVLNGKLDGTTSLTRMRGLKLASTATLEHNNVQANHECSVSLTKRSMEASAANSVKIQLPFLQMEMSQDLSGNTRTKLSLVSKKKLSYMFNVPQIASAGKGSVDMTWNFEALSSHVLLESSAQGKSDMMTMNMFNIAGNLENGETFYISANGLRTTSQTSLSLKMNQQEKRKRSLSSNLFLVDLENTVASDVSLRRVFTTVQCKSKNNVQIRHLSMSGTHVVGAELDLVPLKTFKTKVKCEADQSSSLANAGLNQEINFVISSEKQAFSWSVEERLGSVSHGSDWSIFNKGSEAGMAFSGSVGGNLAFLMSIRLPVYQRTLWDVLGFDEVSNIDDDQFLNFSSAVVYTKNTDGYAYQIPAHLLEDSIMFQLPAFSITLPSWLKEIPHSIRNIDMRLDDVVVPDQVSLPPAVLVPAFNVPFTSLDIESFTVDPKNLNIPKLIITKAFDIKLPSLPVISVPSYDVNTEYLQDKMSFLSFKVPQFDIRVSSFTLPKSITIGDFTISLDDITSHISNFKMPTMVIPEQRVVIPEVILYLPSSIFIPSLGALSATLNISSPIYKVSTTVSVSNKDPDLEGSVSSSCTSTLVFMEYDLTASAVVRYDDEMLRLNGNGRLIHRDGNMNWQYVLDRPLRESRHTLDVDITSQMFTDASVRCASRKDSITASVWSPSAGFLGIHLQRRSSSQLQGKVFSRYLSTPEQDTNILTAKASLRNSDKLVLQTSWSWDSVNNMIRGFKDRIPLMTNALIKFLNKYHTLHFGFDLNRGSVKLRNAVLNLVEKIHRELQAFVSMTQDSVQTAADRGKNAYLEASDILRFTDMVNLTDILMDEVRGGLKHTWHSTEVLLCPVRDFLENKNFSVPGSGEKMSIMEMFSSVMKGISEQIRRTAFAVPGTDIVLDGNKIMETVKRDVAAMLHHAMEFLQRTLKDVLQLLAEKAEHLRVYVEDQNLKVSPLVQLVHRNIRTFSRQQTDQAQTFVSAYKDLVQLKVHEAYSDFSMEKVNSATKGFISTLQSNLSQTVSESLNVMKTASQSAAPYIRVGKEKLDVEVPLPFLWKSFSEWPTLLRP